MPNNNRCRSGLGLAALAALLVGCSASGPGFKPVSLPAGQGAVYLYRPLATAGLPDDFTVRVNKSPLARMEPGTYFPYLAKPGPVYFQFGPDTANIAHVRVEAGVAKYLKASDSTGRLTLIPMAPSIGAREIAQCTQLEASAATAAVPQDSAPVPASPAAGIAPRAARSRSAAIYPPARKPAGSAARRSATDTRPAGQVQGQFSYEAERIAMQRGCVTRDGVRPTAFLIQQSGSLQVYDVACLDQHVRVSCQFEYCQPVGR